MIALSLPGLLDIKATAQTYIAGMDFLRAGACASFLFWKKPEAPLCPPLFSKGRNLLPPILQCYLERFLTIQMTIRRRAHARQRVGLAYVAASRPAGLGALHIALRTAP